jgi:G3E family GTPase
MLSLRNDGEVMALLTESEDANLDGIVDVRDAVLVLRKVVDLADLTEAQVSAADVVTDRIIDVRGAVGILRIIVGLS